jgi:hypothetical protein
VLQPGTVGLADEQRCAKACHGDSKPAEATRIHAMHNSGQIKP